MKTFCKFILIFVCILYLFSCEKDTFEDTPTITENRSGQPVPVFYDGTGVIASSLTINDTVQHPINLYNTDSIQYIGGWLNPFVTLEDGTQTMRYRIKFYSGGSIFLDTMAYTKYRGVSHILGFKQYPTNNEGFNSNVLYWKLTRNEQVLNVYFDEECLKFKREHQYSKEIKYINGTTVTDTLMLRSNQCARNKIVYPKKFK